MHNLILFGIKEANKPIQKHEWHFWKSGEATETVIFFFIND